MRGAAALAVLCGIAALAACGGGDDRLSQEELVFQADAICGEYEGKLDALDEPQSLEDVEALANEAMPIIEKGVDELEQLEPPEDLEDAYDRWIALSRESVAAIDDLKEAAASGDEGRVEQVVRETQAKEEEADALAGRMGLEECARD
jgi:hypothetical protein